MSENTTPIAELCRRYGLSQSELARRFEIPLRTVQDWHAGRRKAPDYVVEMMARLLDLEK
jgi:putative transcriptional regulator